LTITRILAESILNHRAQGRFQAYSAGSDPTGQVNAKAIAALEKAKLPIQGLRSKSINELDTDTTVKFDFVFVLCDKAIEACPVWPNHTITSVWDLENPNEHDDLDVIHEIILALDSRINLLMQLPVEKLEHLKLKQEIDRI